MALPPIVALDIGTSKVLALVAEVRDDDCILVTGMGEHSAVGVKKGEVTHLENAAICVKHAMQAAEESSDSLLQVVKGDKILATYIDPVYPDTSKTQVLYGGPGEVSAELYFTDSDGVKIPDGDFYRPTEPLLYLTYIDDFTDDAQILTLTVKNTTGTGGVSYDTLVTELGAAVKQDSIVI